MTDEDDQGGITLDLFGKFNLAIGDLTEEIKKSNKAEQLRLAMLPVNITIEKMSNPAGATDIVDFGGPQPGRQWIVRLLTAIASPIAANAAVVTWYVGTNVGGPAAGQLPATYARWQFPSVPGFQNFTSNVITVPFPQHVIAGLTGVPGSSFIALTCTVNDQPSNAARTVISSD